MSEIQPLVGICIPVYEQPDLLKRAIKSVIEQEYTNYIVFVTDDSITDSIEEYVIGLKNNKVKYYRNKERLGATSNTNKSLELAIETGVDLIKILYQDDWFSDKQSLGEMVEIQQRTNADIIFSGNIESYIDHTDIHLCSKDDIKNVIQNPLELFKGNVLGAPSILMYKTCNIFLNPRYSWLLDIEFYIRLMKNKKIEYIYKPLISIGHDGDQLTDKFYKKPYKMWLEKVKLFFEIKELQNIRNIIHIIKYLKICISIDCRNKKTKQTQ